MKKNQMRAGIEESFNISPQRIVDFLRHKKSRESFGNENQLGILAESLGVTLVAVGRLKEIPHEELNNQLSLEIEQIGYKTLDEAIDAYRKSMEHYQPSINGRPVQDISSRENYRKR